MPRYQNASTSVVELDGIRIEPGQIVTTEKYIQKALPANVTLVDAVGFYDPTLLSQKVTSTSTVSVPAGLVGNYRIIIFCLSGEVTVKANAATATARFMCAGDRLEWLCTSRVIDNVILTIATAVVYVTIEKC
jgi:hypothetical protein